MLGFSDEWFAEASNLLTPTAPIRQPGKMVYTGAWYDGKSAVDVDAVRLQFWSSWTAGKTGFTSAPVRLIPCSHLLDLQPDSLFSLVTYLK